MLFSRRSGSEECAVHFGLAWALSTLFFSPYLFISNPQFNFFGDVAILYFPQFVEGYHMARSGALLGLDLLTSNGSTAYFLRPNIPVYYPPYQLIYALFRFETIEGLARAFVFIAYAHSLLSTYYCLRIGRKFFQLDHGSSILFSVLYFGASSYSAFTAPPFYYVASLFPFLLYFALYSVNETKWWRVFLFSFPYVMVFLSGYLPLDVNAVLIALLFVVIFFWHSKNDESQTNRKILLKLLSPVVLAIAVVLSLYLAMYFYHKQVSGVANGVWHSAHQFSFESRDIFSLISRAFPPSNPGTGTPFVHLGLVSVFILALTFSQRRKLAISLLDSRLIALCLLIFSFYLLLAFGQASGLPDIFYFVMPVIGRMHFYGRYLLIASFFFYLAVAISFKYLIHIRNELPIGRLIVSIFLLMFAVETYNQGNQSTSISTKLFVVELLMISLMLFALSARQNFYAIAVSIGMSFFIHAANFNSYTNSFSQVAAGPYRNDVAFSKERRELLINYFKQNSSKYLIKYADLTSGIEKSSGVMLNFPWLVSDKIKISNYMGYEPHMSLDRDYMAKYPHPYYGSINVPWLLETGADFIIYNDSAWSVNSSLLEQYLDKNIPELDLQFGYKVAKLKDASGLVDYIPRRNEGDFDNGIVRISNTNETTSVIGFQTDFVSRINFHVDSSSPVIVRYALFPHKMMELRINGKFADSTIKGGLLEFSLPPGRHLVEYEYKNRLHQLFTIIYRIYLIILFYIITWRVWIAFSLFRKSLAQKNQKGN